MLLLNTGIVLLGALWLLDGFRLRQRLARIPILDPQAGSERKDYTFVARTGVVFDARLRNAAAAFADANELEVLVLMPKDLSLHEALLTLQNYDPNTFRKNRLARGICLGEIILIKNSLVARFGGVPPLVSSAEEFLELARELKKFANAKMDVAIVPKLKTGRSSLIMDAKLLETIYGPLSAIILLLQFVLLVVSFRFASHFAWIALGGYLLQPLVSFAGSRLAPDNLWLFAALRPVWDLGSLCNLILSAFRQDKKSESESLRPEYEALMSDGVGRFFEKTRSDCPLCDASGIETVITSRDLIQCKPGVFTLAHCPACEHIFQNPRLSLDGLGFYYKDFYDGLGAKDLEGMFSQSTVPYRARAEMLLGKADPKRWLDVGGGHGHFCLVAKDVWPGTSFDVLDLSESVEIAKKRGWVHHSYRGLFPDVAATSLGRESYDVISMSHYLEHTRDPMAELKAAALVIADGGHLLIELPDPECRLGRIFGSFWLPWLQPQHQHFLSAKNLDNMLRSQSLYPVEWHRGEAHQPSDFALTFALLLNRIAKPSGLPWQKRSSVYPNYGEASYLSWDCFRCLPCVCSITWLHR